MSSVGSDILDLLSTGGLGTAGVDLFVNWLPESTGSTGPRLGVFETGGSPPIERFASTTPAMELPTVQVRVQSTDAGTGEKRASSTSAADLMNSSWKLLVGISNSTVNSRRYQRIEPMQSPTFLRRDDRDRAEFVCNFMVWRDPPA